MNPLILEVNRQDLKKQVPSFRPGDTVRVAVRILEGDKERIQNFEGVCIGRHGTGMDETFTVRRVSFGVGMERIFPLHSPRIESIMVVRQGRVRRAKLYYLRERTGKKARLAETRRKREARDYQVDVQWAEQVAELSENTDVEDVKVASPEPAEEAAATAAGEEEKS